MAFPEDPLGLRVEVRTGTEWMDITARCKTLDPIVYSCGTRHSGVVAQPATAPLRIDNRDGHFTPRNPLSPLWGLINRNTPVRLWLPGGEHFLDLDGDAASYASTPDDDALDITGDLDLRWEGEANWHASGAQFLVGKWDAEGGERSYHMRLQDGRLYLHVARDSTGGPAGFWALPRLPERAALRATLEDGETIRLYWATSIEGPWTQFGDSLTLPSPLSGGIHVSTAPLTITPSQTDSTPVRRPFEGRVYKAEVRDGIDGTVVACPDFTALPLGADDFEDDAGRTWTLAGAAAIADRQDICTLEIARWPQRWVPTRALVWTPVEAAGILRRLQQGARPLDSTLRRRIPTGSPDAYWPFEEESSATRAYSPITGVQPAAVTGVEWASVDTLPSSRALPRLTAAASLSAIVPSTASTGQWQVEFVYNADDKAPAAATEIASISATGTVRRWSLRMQAGLARVVGYSAGGTAIVDQPLTIGGDVFHGWVRLRFWAQTVDSDIEWRIAWQDVGGDAGGLTRTVAGSAGRVTAVTADWGEATEGWAVGHLAVLPVADSSLYDGSDNAFSGETAWERIARLCSEEGVPVARLPGLLTPELVGPQRTETLVQVLQDAAAADGGMLVEDRRLGLLYRDRSSLYTQDPVMTLAYGSRELATPLEPDDDADTVRNDRTITREGGSSARAVLEEGPLSVQPPPLGIGLYDDSQTLSLASDVQTEPIAYWQLHLGTQDAARYPTVRILLHRAPHLIPAFLRLRPGDLIRLTGLPPHVAYGPVDLIVTGWSSRMLPRSWEVLLTCEPGVPWMTAKADHAVYGKASAGAGYVLADGVDADDTALAVTVADDLPWTTDPAEMPILIDVGGEHMSVTAIGAEDDGAQEFTVVRSANGVTKSHEAGAAVEMAYRAIAPL